MVGPTNVFTKIYYLSQSFILDSLLFIHHVFVILVDNTDTSYSVYNTLVLDAQLLE